KLYHAVADLDQRRDDVIAKPARARLDVGGEVEIIERRQRRALRLSHPELRHRTHPRRNGALAAYLVHFQGAIESAPTLDLEISDAKAAQADCVLKLQRAVQTLIQADRRAQLLLHLHHLLQRGSGQRLLEHHQAEVVERAEYVQILQRIS